MTERESSGKRPDIVIDGDAHPEFEEALKALEDKGKKKKESPLPDFSRTNAIAGEQQKPRRALRRGLQPQK